MQIICIYKMRKLTKARKISTQVIIMCWLSISVFFFIILNKMLLNADRHTAIIESIQLAFKNGFIGVRKSILFANRFKCGNTTLPGGKEKCEQVLRRMRDEAICSTNIHLGNPQIKVSFEVLPWEELERKFKYLRPGGHHIPDNCSLADRVAVVVPYFNRESHLRVLLNNMHSFLTEQELDYSIIIVEQVAKQTFNRGKLLNVGFIEAMKLYNWQCVLFHDVDLLPEDKRNLHLCPTQNPQHMSVAIDKFNYTLLYEQILGGSTLFTVDQFREINGFSNQYWGWGGEDDDLYVRTIRAGFDVIRYDATIARYKMLAHNGSEENRENPCRHKLLNRTFESGSDGSDSDGLNSTRYKILNVTLKSLYTHIVVDLLENEERPFIAKQFCCDDYFSEECETGTQPTH